MARKTDIPSSYGEWLRLCCERQDYFPLRSVPAVECDGVVFAVANVSAGCQPPGSNASKRVITV